MKPEITSRKDIKFIISSFYDKLLADEKMFLFFKEIVAEDSLEHHLEVITDFWEDLLFLSYKYKNNPMKKHLDFQQKKEFTKEHFDLWLQYLIDTISTNFDGETAHAMKTRANSIAMVMQMKMGLYQP